MHGCLLPLPHGVVQAGQPVLHKRWARPATRACSRSGPSQAHEQVDGGESEKAQPAKQRQASALGASQHQPPTPLQTQFSMNWDSNLDKPLGKPHLCQCVHHCERQVAVLREHLVQRRRGAGQQQLHSRSGRSLRSHRAHQGLSAIKPHPNIRSACVNGRKRRNCRCAMCSASAQCAGRVWRLAVAHRAGMHAQTFNYSSKSMGLTAKLARVTQVCTCTEKGQRTRTQRLLTSHARHGTSVTQLVYLLQCTGGAQDLA